MVLDNIGWIKKYNLKVSEIPFKYRIGFTENFADFEKIASIEGKFNEIVNITKGFTSEIQNPGIPEIQSNQ